MINEQVKTRDKYISEYVRLNMRWFLLFFIKLNIFQFTFNFTIDYLKPSCPMMDFMKTDEHSLQDTWKTAWAVSLHVFYESQQRIKMIEKQS